jgi:hypothetical protein
MMIHAQHRAWQGLSMQFPGRKSSTMLQICCVYFFFFFFFFCC